MSSYKEKFVARARDKFGDAYGYRKVDYVDARTVVSISCKRHGLFSMTPAQHLRIGCLSCSAERQNAARESTYIANLKEKHPNVGFLGPYNAATAKTAHRCACGTKFMISPTQAITRDTAQCSACGRLARKEALRLTEEGFVRQLSAAHGTAYQLVGKFTKGMHNTFRFRCNKCHTTFKTTGLKAVNRQVPCPRCSGEEHVARARSAGRAGGYKIKHVTLGGQEFACQGYEPQAIAWLLKKPNIKPSDIKTDLSGEVPTFLYSIGRRTRRYFPDILIQKQKHIVEVKSVYTLGLTTGKGWRKNQAKAKAVLDAGYKFTVLVMENRGTRICQLPKDWFSMSRKDVVLNLAMRNADIVPDGFSKFKRS